MWNKAQLDAVNPLNTDFLMGKENCLLINSIYKNTCTVDLCEDIIWRGY